uniref:Uncharacterized protein n=1 Tax=Lepeophtheirus salmonis TaxID=72036 RepID=A0A0K2T8H0_LEPSM
MTSKTYIALLLMSVVLLSSLSETEGFFGNCICRWTQGANCKTAADNGKAYTGRLNLGFIVLTSQCRCPGTAPATQAPTTTTTTSARTTT